MNTEAPVSVTFSLIDPNGFPILLTFRADDPRALMESLEDKSNWLKAHNFKPQEKKAFGPREKKPLDVVTDRKCPECGGDLVRKETKTGKKLIECVNRKYDFATQKEVGSCKFVEWQN
jgi:hypothetical protein